MEEGAAGDQAALHLASYYMWVVLCWAPRDTGNRIGYWRGHDKTLHETSTLVYNMQHECRKATSENLDFLPFVASKPALTLVMPLLGAPPHLLLRRPPRAMLEILVHSALRQPEACKANTPQLPFMTPPPCPQADQAEGACAWPD